jgi:hypothetical protein
MRVLDGLEGASSSGGRPLDRQAMGRVLAALGNRVFLMHNVHEDAPEILESRWAMSYLRGPLTRTQIKTLMDPRRGEFAPPKPPAEAAPPASATRAADAAASASASRAFSSAPAVSARLILPPEIPQFFAPAPGRATFVPMLVGHAQVRFTDTKARVDVTRDVTVVTPITHDAVPVDWTAARDAEFAVSDLAKDPPPGATFAELPSSAQKTKSYGDWTKTFTAWLTREQSLELFRSDALGLVSKPGESEADFRVRLQQAAREARDAAVTKLRQKYASKVATLQERLRRAEQEIQKQSQQASASNLDTVVSVGTSVLGALFGRKSIATGVGQAARGVTRARRESLDVTRAQENKAAVEAQLREIEETVQAEVAGIEAAHSPLTEPLETLALKPKRTGVLVQLVALTWVAE